MNSGAGACLLAVAALHGATPSFAQSRDGGRLGTPLDVVSQTVSVPVYPGQMLAATVTLPKTAETPVPAVLLLTVREPRTAPSPASDAMFRALLTRGIAVVRLDLPPAPAARAVGAEPLAQPADDAFAVLQFVRAREDIDGDRVAMVGIGVAAGPAVRAAGMDAALRALVLLGAEPVSRDTLDLPTSFPLMALPLAARAAPAQPTEEPTPAAEAAAFLARHLQ